MTGTIAKRELRKLATADLIDQYDRAISRRAGWSTITSPRQRIDFICDMLLERAENGDSDARAWIDAAVEAAK